MTEVRHCDTIHLAIAILQCLREGQGITIKCVHHLRVGILKALASHTRLHILDLLSEGEMTVCDIAKALEGNQSTISCHLNSLRTTGLVATRKEGTHVYYTIADETVNEVLELLDEILKTQCLSDSEVLELIGSD